MVLEDCTEEQNKERELRRRGALMVEVPWKMYCQGSFHHFTPFFTLAYPCPRRSPSI